MYTTLRLILTGVFAFSSLACAGAAELNTIRHLVYSFDVTIRTDMQVKTSGIGNGDSSLHVASVSGTGTNHYGAGDSDQGTIAVDVLQVQPDNGLVVKISEQSRGDRNAEPALCVVYGIGSVICDSSKKVNEEEMALLRLLGRGFVNPSTIDAKHHWSYDASTPEAKENNDYTIVGQHGDLTDISLQRVLTVSGAQGYVATTDGSLSYDQKRSAPTKVEEDTVTRQHVDIGQDNRTETQVTLTLQHDSLASSTP